MFRLTMVRYWYTPGKPRGSVPTLGSFQKWANTIGSILGCVGVESFLGTIADDFEQANEEDAEIENFLQALREVFEDSTFQTADVVKQYQDEIKKVSADGTEYRNVPTLISSSPSHFELPDVHDHGLPKFRKQVGWFLTKIKDRRCTSLWRINPSP